MIIGGFQKLSLIDYPGCLSAVLFTQGCNFKCPYCHNPGLIPVNNMQNSCNISVILEYLRKRCDKLDGVVITGGEPTIHPDMPGYLEIFKSMGYKVKIDTNGTRPDSLQDLINNSLVDFIAMDIKAPFKKYDILAGRRVNFTDIKKSRNIIINSGLDHEFRTTLARPFLEKKDIYKMASFVKGGAVYKLQACNNMYTGLKQEEQYSEHQIQIFQKRLEAVI